jgi:hypothetical protein
MPDHQHAFPMCPSHGRQQQPEGGQGRFSGRMSWLPALDSRPHRSPPTLRPLPPASSPSWPSPLASSDAAQPHARTRYTPGLFIGRLEDPGLTSQLVTVCRGSCRVDGRVSRPPSGQVARCFVDFRMSTIRSAWPGVCTMDDHHGQAPLHAWKVLRRSRSHRDKTGSLPDSAPAQALHAACSQLCWGATRGCKTLHADLGRSLAIQEPPRHVSRSLTTQPSRRAGRCGDSLGLSCYTGRTTSRGGEFVWAAGFLP